MGHTTHLGNPGETSEEQPNPKPKWETILEHYDTAEDSWDCTQLMKVNGGYLYRTILERENQLTIGLTFVPDQSKPTSQDEITGPR